MTTQVDRKTIVNERRQVRKIAKSEVKLRKEKAKEGNGRNRH